MRKLENAVVLTTMLLAVFLLSLAPIAHAQWIEDGVPVCTAIDGQHSGQIVSDGAGGAIITWCDERNGEPDIYAQRLDASGVAQWTADGIPLCTIAGSQVYPTIVSDNAGGAIIAWHGVGGIRVQRVDASGAIQWVADGITLCTTGNEPVIISDEAGGAIVAWNDTRSDPDPDIYAQRVDGSGAVQWTTNGVPLCTASHNQEWYTKKTIVSDGAGGAIVVWQDYRSDSYPDPDWDVYAQRVNASGTVQWTTNGVPLCVASGDQTWPSIAPDGAGGAIVAWADHRGGGSDIYAQRVDASGAVQWTADGLDLCTATGYRAPYGIVPDGAGGAIVTWWDSRNGNDDIYVQRVDGDGVLQWATDGLALCTAAGEQQRPAIVQEGVGGAIVAWEDYRESEYGIYAQRIGASGTVQWTTDGVALCRGEWYLTEPVIASDGGGGAIVGWKDWRNEPILSALLSPASTNIDIFAQHVTHHGNIGSDPVPLSTSAVLLGAFAVASLGVARLYRRERRG